MSERIRTVGPSRLHTCLFAALLASALGGCQANPMPAITAAYTRGDFPAAFAAGRDLADRGGPRSAEAAYLAGKSARKLNDTAAAERYLRQAANQAEAPRPAAEALAELGMLVASLGRHEEAGGLLLKAAPALEPSDRLMALSQAGLALQKAGRWPQAQACFTQAAGQAGRPEEAAWLRDQAAMRAFTLQFGAYAVGKTANDRGLALKPVVERARLGPVRIVEIQRGGQRLHLVQVGRFPRHAEALAAARAVGDRETAVVATPLP